MKGYRFEIVRRAGRFGWIFVRIDDQGRRVLARSELSYRKRKRVCKEIAAIAALEDPWVVDTTKDYPFRLPARSFKLSPRMPVIVDESPLADYDAIYMVSAEIAGQNDHPELADRGATEREAAAPPQERKRRKSAPKKAT